MREHCEWLEAEAARWRAEWLAPAAGFFQEVRPASLPERVVYPFGGGDLLTALAVFPDAREISTISLEVSGDLRPVDSLDAQALGEALTTIRAPLGYLLDQSLTTTTRLQQASAGPIPGMLSFSLVALAIHGFEPVSLRYLALRRDGSIRYLGAQELERGEPGKAFRHVEIRFRRRGGDPEEPRVYRHFAANLDDEHLLRDGALLKHLQARGEVAAMTKAGSLLLWYGSFSVLRGFLLDHASWMVSDYSGIPPEHAARAGLEQLAYGAFEGLRANRRDRFVGTPGHDERVAAVEQFRRLWASSQLGELPFRFGYRDVNGRANLLITRKKTAGDRSGIPGT